MFARVIKCPLKAFLFSQDCRLDETNRTGKPYFDNMDKNGGTLNTEVGLFTPTHTHIHTHTHLKSTNGRIPVWPSTTNLKIWQQKHTEILVIQWCIYLFLSSMPWNVRVPSMRLRFLYRTAEDNPAFIAMAIARMKNSSLLLLLINKLWTT